MLRRTSARATAARPAGRRRREIARQQRLLPVVEGGVAVARAEARAASAARRPSGQQRRHRRAAIAPPRRSGVRRHGDVAPRRAEHLGHHARPPRARRPGALEDEQGRPLAEHGPVVVGRERPASLGPAAHRRQAPIRASWRYTDGADLVDAADDQASACRGHQAAARATARSPATVAWFTVTVGPCAPTAMATCAAIEFITVLGKIIGDSPPGRAGDIRGELLAGAEVAVLGADHDASPRPARRRVHHGQARAATASWQMRDRRRARRGRRGGEAAGSTSAARRLGPARRRRLAPGRCRSGRGRAPPRRRRARRRRARSPCRRR